MMRRGPRLKVIVLASVSLFVVGIWCKLSAGPLYRATSGSAPADLLPFGSPSFCSKPSLDGFDFLFTFMKTGGHSGSGNSGSVGEFFVFSLIDSLRIQSNLLSGQDNPFIPKVSLQILNSVFIL